MISNTTPRITDIPAFPFALQSFIVNVLNHPGQDWLPNFPRIFVDMDGVMVNFDGYKKHTGLDSDAIKKKQGAYLDMQPIPGAIDAVRKLISMGFDVWLATKPPTGVAHAYSDKAAWVFKYLPELSEKLIITHDKGLLGTDTDIIVDDRPDRANVTSFPGLIIPFIDGVHWPDAMSVLVAIADAITLARDEIQAADDEAKLVQGAWYWIEYHNGIEAITTPAEYASDVKSFRSNGLFISADKVGVISRIAHPDDIDEGDDGPGDFGFGQGGYGMDACTCPSCVSDDPEPGLLSRLAGSRYPAPQEDQAKNIQQLLDILSKPLKRH